MANRIIPLINAARTSPDRTGDSLYQNLKTQFSGNIMSAFDKKVETFEGIKGLQDLHKYLSTLAPVGNLVENPALNRAAAEIAAEKGKTGDTTHQKPRAINSKVELTSNLQGKVGQLICLNTNSPQQALAYFLIDDGLLSRKRRRMLLDPAYKYIGSGVATHAQYAEHVQ